MTYTRIRKETFSKNYPFDPELAELVRHEKDYKFLYTPASQLCCQYMTKYIGAVASHHFKRGIGSVRILDWGCGKGWVTYFLKKDGADVTCCDVVTSKTDSSFGQPTPIIDKYSLEVVPLRHEYALPFADNSFDVVLSVGVLEHVGNERESLKEVRRILGENGLFICFNLPYYFSWVQRALHVKGNFYHDRLYTKRGARKLLAEAQFGIADIWHRQLYPRSSIPFSWYYALERFDQFLDNHTPLKYFTNYIEFLAVKQ